MALRVILFFLPILLLRAPAYAQSAQLDASKAMFTVLAAINAAGYNDGLESPSSHPIRKQIRAEIAKANPPSVADIKDFMRQHRQENATWELRQYISYSLLVTDPPEFAWRIKEYQLPPDVTALREFAPILQKFYKEANIEDLWKRSQPAFEQMMARYSAARDPGGDGGLSVSAFAYVGHLHGPGIQGDSRRAGRPQPDSNT